MVYIIPSPLGHSTVRVEVVNVVPVGVPVAVPVAVQLQKALVAN